MSRQRPLVAVFDLVTSVGGVQSVMARLLPNLAGHLDVVVLDPYRNPDYSRMLAASGLEVSGLGSAPRRRFIGGANRVARVAQLARRAPWLASTGLRLRSWVRARRPSAIWFNQLPSLSVFSAFLPADGPAVVFHAHGFASAADLRAGPRLGRRCARVLAVSHAVAGTLHEAGVDRAKVTVVHNGVDPGELARRAMTPAAPLPPRFPCEVVLVHAAVLAPHKQQHVAVDALATLPSHAVLWLCGGVPEGGDPAYEAALRGRVARLGLGGRVRFLGWRPDLPAVLAAADVAILPSAEESFGMVLAEAMALGRPCVGAAVGGIPEVMEHGRTGFVVAPEPAAFAAALGLLVASPEARRAMGEAGRRRVETLFTLERQARRVAEELEALVARGAATDARARSLPIGGAP